MLLIAIIVYGGIQTNMMFKREDTNISIKSFIKDRTNDREVYVPFPQIQLSFIVEKEGVDLLQQGGYIDIVVNLVQQTYEYNPALGMKERKRTKTVLPYEKCGTNFNSSDKELLENLNIKNYYCFKDNSFSIGGSYFSPVFHYLELRMSTCQSSPKKSCKTADEIKKAMDAADVKLGISNNYVDLQDYEMPVKNFIDDSFYWESIPGFRKKVDIELQKNIGNFQDELLQLWDVNTQYFFQVQKGRESTILTNSDGEFMTIYLRTDEQYQQYDRKVYSIGDLVGQIGGFFEVLHAVGAFLTMLIAYKLYDAYLASSVFQVNNHYDDGDDDQSDRRKLHHKDSNSQRADIDTRRLNSNTKQKLTKLDVSRGASE